MITHRNKIDMCPGRVPVVIHVSQYDDDFSLIFEPYSSAGEFTLQASTTAEIRGTKTDGTGYSASATVSDGKVTVTGHQQMTAVSGKQIFELTLKKNNKELNTANFILDVEPAALDRNTIVSESKIMELLDVTDEADEIMAAAELVQETLSTLGFTDPNNDGNIIITMGVQS